ncbi:epimerase family protein SDR39U1 isoform X2 [Buteo buteo]|uniref:epimerase family protein SDR39U1 isoform X2 n=1 Tax=Buteo buteo TaxID=30397 RepID=UPI003EB776C3
MRVLVGGGTGFVGRALTQLLRSRGHEVTHVSRQGGKDRISWEELSQSGLPLCDAVVNLAGENVLNPFRRWSDAFCREVISSRVETTKTLAKAIADAEQPPRAWVLVTGVGYYRPSPTAEYTEDSPGGDFDFFSRLVSSWEAAALIPGSPARGVVVRSGEMGHRACSGWLCFGAGARGGRGGRRTSGLVPLLVGVLFQSSPLKDSLLVVVLRVGKVLFSLCSLHRGGAGPRWWCHLSNALAFPSGTRRPLGLWAPALPMDPHSGSGWDRVSCPGEKMSH